jgi:O-antigen ligase
MHLNSEEIGMPLVKTDTLLPDQKDALVESNEILAGSGEELRRGMWPRSLPLWMTAFYVALFIIRPWEYLIPELGKIHFERNYAIFMIIVVLLGRKNPFRMTFQTIAVLLFIGALGISSFFAWDPTLSWKPMYVYLTLLVFYFILLLAIRTPYELVFIITVYIITMAVYLAKSQWEFFVHGAHRSTMGVTRLIGIEYTFGGPNWLAGSIILSLPFVVFLWSVRKELAQSWPNFWRKWFPRFLIAYFALAISSVILTNSRAGMLGLIVFVVLFTFRGAGISKKVGYFLIAVLFLASLWLVMPEENRNRFRSIWDPQAGPSTALSSARGRIEGLRAGITMYERFPLSGVGVGNFVQYRKNNVDGVALRAHNLVGETLGETGLVGGTTFLLVVIALLANCRRIKTIGRGHPDPTLTTLSKLALACRDGVILLIYEGLFSHNLLRFNWLWFAAFTVLAVQFARKNIQEK